MPGHDAVVSCLGIRRRHAWNPWSRRSSPPDLAGRAMTLTMGAMQSAGVTRIGAISAAGAGDSVGQVSPIVSWMIRFGNVAVAYRDLTAMEAVLERSDADWLIVRPVTLVNGSPNERAREASRFRLTSVVRRSDVAHYLVGAIETEERLGNRKVLLSG